MKRGRCKSLLAMTNAKNGSNLKNGKHRRSASKRATLTGRRAEA